MRTLESNQLVELWEQAEDQPPWQKALMILAAMCPESSREHIAKWPVGYRDSRLFVAHAQQFGPWLEVQGRCGHCAAGIDLRFHTDAVLVDDPGGASAHYSWVQDKGYRVRVRPPTTEDLLEVVNRGEAGTALLTRLIAEVKSEDNLPLVVDNNNIAELATIVEPYLHQIQPLSEVTINACCPECQRETPHVFDILDHFWRRISAQVRRVLWDVHVLARAYGWSGAEILALSPARRRQHIAMVMS